jgi:hypothetical protein
MPFVRGKPENRAVGVLAVANADPAARQVGHLDAVAVGKTQGALKPVRAGTRPSRTAPGHDPSHVFYLAECRVINGSYGKFAEDY